MTLLSSRTFALAALVVLIPSVARADVTSDLERAEKLASELDYEQASGAAEAALHEHRIPHDALLRALRLLGRVQADLGRAEAARATFIKLLEYNPDEKVDPALSPRVYAAFMEARGYWHDRPRPGIDVAIELRATGPAELHVATSDPLHDSRRVVVAYRWGATAPFTTQALSTDRARDLDVPAPPLDSKRFECYAAAFDENDNAIFELGTATEPLSRERPPPPPDSSNRAPPSVRSCRARSSGSSREAS